MGDKLEAFSTYGQDTDTRCSNCKFWKRSEQQYWMLPAGAGECSNPARAHLRVQERNPWSDNCCAAFESKGAV